MQKLALPFVACLLAIAATGVSAQSVWKWRDAAGQLHISDTPPPNGTAAKDVIQRPGSGGSPLAAPAPAASTATAALGTSSPDSDLEKKKKQADREKADKAASDKAAAEQKNAAARRDNCQHAQAQVGVMQSGIRIATMNAQGEREYLDDAARAAELKRSQQIAAESCGPAPAAQ
jgi:hypothetical protein